MYVVVGPTKANYNGISFESLMVVFVRLIIGLKCFKMSKMKE